MLFNGGNMAASGGGRVGSSPVIIDSREDLVKHILARKADDSTASKLAVAILTGGDVTPFLDCKKELSCCVIEPHFRGAQVGFSALELAALSGHRVAIELFKKHAPSLFVQNLFSGNTPAHFAALSGDMELAEEACFGRLKFTENHAGAMPIDIYDLTHAHEEPPLRRFHARALDILQLWMAGLARERYSELPTEKIRVSSLLRKEELPEALVEVKETADRGEGVFAKKRIEKGGIIGVFGGVFSLNAYAYHGLKGKERERLFKTTGVFPFEGNGEYIMRSNDTTHALLGKANDGLSNMASKLVTIPGLPEVAKVCFATEDIEEGDEVLNSYGQGHMIKYVGHKVSRYDTILRQIHSGDIQFNLASYVATTPPVLLKLIQDPSVTNTHLDELLKQALGFIKMLSHLDHDEGLVHLNKLHNMYYKLLLASQRAKGFSGPYERRKELFRLYEQLVASFQEQIDVTKDHRVAQASYAVVANLLYDELDASMRDLRTFSLPRLLEHIKTKSYFVKCSGKHGEALGVLIDSRPFEGAVEISYGASRS